MEFEIITESPSWLTILCVLAGFLSAFLLYRNDKRFSELARWVILFMAFLRFSVISLLCFLLLSPLFKTTTRETQKPIVAVLIDNSKSMIHGKDSMAFSKEISNQLSKLKDKIGNDCEVRVFSISDKLSDGIINGFNGMETDLSLAVDEMKSRFSGLNLSALVLATDGLYNKGADPGYAFQNLSVPIYTVGYGDTTVKKDLFIQDVRFNPNVFLGNSFPIEISFNARELSGQRAKLNLISKGSTIAIKEIDITSSRFSNVSTFIIEAKEKGLTKYEIRIDPLHGEENTSNNSRTIFIDVNSIRSKILLTHSAPHPDIAAIKSVLETNSNYELIENPQSTYTGPSTDLKLAILHQIPSKTSGGKNIVEQLFNARIPVLFILGSGTSTIDFNALDIPIRIEDANGGVTDALPSFNNTFSLFKIDESLISRIPSFPPLSVPFGNYSFKSEGYTLFNQTIGNTKTDMPLMVYFPNETPKKGFICGEGLWKWRLNEFRNHNSTETFSAILLKSIQYMLSAENKNPFKLTYKNSYEENEQITIDAGVFNEVGEQIKDAEVSMIIQDENAKNYSFAFSNSNGIHTLNAGFLSPGIYSFKATAKAGSRSFFEEGKFIVSALESELSDLVADHLMLRSLAIKTGGIFTKSDLSGVIADSIIVRKDLKPMIYTKKSMNEAVNLKWIFFLLALLISSEWFLRKRNGGY
ncbi:MAG: hypothetical protein ACK5C5_01265 [Bacteroidota bacterium]